MPDETTPASELKAKNQELVNAFALYGGAINQIDKFIVIRDQAKARITQLEAEIAKGDSNSTDA